MEWYKIKAKVLELLYFLLDTELIIDKEHVIDFVSHPERYNEVWNLYQKEINGVVN
jgi:hypothetical protein